MADAVAVKELTGGERLRREGRYGDNVSGLLPAATGAQGLTDYPLRSSLTPA